MVYASYLNEKWNQITVTFESQVSISLPEFFGCISFGLACSWHFYRYTKWGLVENTRNFPPPVNSTQELDTAVPVFLLLCASGDFKWVVMLMELLSGHSYVRWQHRHPKQKQNVLQFIFIFICGFRWHFLCNDCGYRYVNITPHKSSYGDRWWEHRTGTR